MIDNESRYLTFQDSSLQRSIFRQIEYQWWEVRTISSSDDCLMFNKARLGYRVLLRIRFYCLWELERFYLPEWSSTFQSNSSFSASGITESSWSVTAIACAEVHHHGPLQEAIHQRTTPDVNLFITKLFSSFCFRFYQSNHQWRSGAMIFQLEPTLVRSFKSQVSSWSKCFNTEV